jgi:fumarate hydratase class II
MLVTALAPRSAMMRPRASPSMPMPGHDPARGGLALGLVDEATFDRLVRPQDMV